ncbi:MAG TPA: hypothetical protein VGP82_03265, partial [Ktedonobacterales bacterium]|nr:hypothetical protein [Ktedonobacterales bacterium]
MHYLRFEPHAILVHEEIYRYFSGLVQPSLAEVVRHWERERLVWPFFGPEIDPRVVKAASGNRLRDEALGGYRIQWPQVQSILTDVTHLGYRICRGDYAQDAAGEPLLCHEPLVDADLFWWCYDRVATEHPPWPWVPVSSPTTPVTAHIRQPRKVAARTQPTVRYLAQGRIRCIVHQKAFVIRQDREHDGVRLGCNGPKADYHLQTRGLCPSFPPASLEEALLCDAFIDQLKVDERDLAEIARHIDQRNQSHEGQRHTQLQREFAGARARLQRALEQGLR